MGRSGQFNQCNTFVNLSQKYYNQHAVGHCGHEHVFLGFSMKILLQLSHDSVHTLSKATGSVEEGATVSIKL